MAHVGSQALKRTKLLRLRSAKRRRSKFLTGVSTALVHLHRKVRLLGRWKNDLAVQFSVEIR